MELKVDESIIAPALEEEMVMVDPVNACSLIGAYETCLSTRDILPIIHGTGGCPCFMWLQMVSSPIYTGLAQLTYPTTCVSEGDIVYGGEKKLLDGIAKAMNIWSPRMIMIIASCTPAIIGDDIHFIAKKMGKKFEIPIVAVDTRSSRWDYLEGRVSAQLALIRNVMKDGKFPREKTVNILGICPGDYNWQGDLEELKRLLEGIGLKINSAIPSMGSLEEMERAPQASLNIVVSAECGLAPAQEMEKLFGIPYIELIPPYGLSETETWLRTISERMNLNKKKVDAFIKNESKKAADTIVPHLTSFGQVRLLRGIPTAIFGDASRVCGLIGFITKELGMRPALVGLKHSTEKTLQNLTHLKEELGLDFRLVTKVKSIEDVVTSLGNTKIDFIFGSDIDKKLGSRQVDTDAFVEFTAPIFFKFNISNRPYMGFKGAIYLYEQIINARMVMYQSNRPYGSFWDLLP